MAATRVWRADSPTNGTLYANKTYVRIGTAGRVPANGGGALGLLKVKQRSDGGAIEALALATSPMARSAYVKMVMFSNSAGPIATWYLPPRGGAMDYSRSCCRTSERD